MSILKVDAIQSRGSSDSAITFSGGLLLPRSVIMQVKAKNTDISHTSSSTKVEWQTVEIDTINGWDSTNNRYTPSVSGYYQFGGSLRVSVVSSNPNQFFLVKVLKNGDDTDRHAIQLNVNSDLLLNNSVPIPSGIVQLNGSTDYIEVHFASDEGTILHDSTSIGSYFFATLVHAT
tara:strand:+ start:51 stop:575 length:525 start_codon:yes stop_codon:yes gene_type:complete